LIFMIDNDQGAFSAISQVHPSEALALRDGGAILLDVRTPDEFAAGHAPDVAFIPLHELETHFEEIPTTAPLVLVCRSGVRSQTAAEFLLAQGYTVANLSGGMIAWASAGLPVISDDGGPGTIA
jgi:rhodanese-related sulfurtransferase